MTIDLLTLHGELNGKLYYPENKGVYNKMLTEGMSSNSEETLTHLLENKKKLLETYLQQILTLKDSIAPADTVVVAEESPSESGGNIDLSNILSILEYASPEDMKKAYRSNRLDLDPLFKKFSVDKAEQACAWVMRECMVSFIQSSDYAPSIEGLRVRFLGKNPQITNIFYITADAEAFSMLDELLILKGEESAYHLKDLMENPQGGYARVVGVIKDHMQKGQPITIASLMVFCKNHGVVIDTTTAENVFELLVTLGGIARNGEAWVVSPRLVRLTSMEIYVKGSFVDVVIGEELRNESSAGPNEMIIESEGVKEITGTWSEIVQSLGCDSLITEAARLVVENEHGSQSMISRRLGTGTNRAESIMNQLEVLGVVGPLKVGEPLRNVLIDVDYFEEIVAGTVSLTIDLTLAKEKGLTYRLSEKEEKGKFTLQPGWHKHVGTETDKGNEQALLALLGQSSEEALLLSFKHGTLSTEGIYELDVDVYLKREIYIYFVGYIVPRFLKEEKYGINAFYINRLLQNTGINSNYLEGVINKAITYNLFEKRTIDGSHRVEVYVPYNSESEGFVESTIGAVVGEKSTIFYEVIEVLMVHRKASFNNEASLSFLKSTFPSRSDEDAQVVLDFLYSIGYLHSHTKSGYYIRKFEGDIKEFPLVVCSGFVLPAVLGEGADDELSEKKREVRADTTDDDDSSSPEILPDIELFPIEIPVERFTPDSTSDPLAVPAPATSDTYRESRNNYYKKSIVYCLLDKSTNPSKKLLELEESFKKYLGKNDLPQIKNIYNKYGLSNPYAMISILRTIHIPVPSVLRTLIEIIEKNLASDITRNKKISIEYRKIHYTSDFRKEWIGDPNQKLLESYAMSYLDEVFDSTSEEYALFMEEYSRRLFAAIDRIDFSTLLPEGTLEVIQKRSEEIIKDVITKKIEQSVVEELGLMTGDRTRDEGEFLQQLEVQRLQFVDLRVGQREKKVSFKERYKERYKGNQEQYKKEGWLKKIAINTKYALDTLFTGKTETLTPGEAADEWYERSYLHLPFYAKQQNFETIKPEVKDVRAQIADLLAIGLLDIKSESPPKLSIQVKGSKIAVEKKLPGGKLQKIKQPAREMKTVGPAHPYEVLKQLFSEKFGEGDDDIQSQRRFFIALSLIKQQRDSIYHVTGQNEFIIKGKEGGECIKARVSSDVHGYFQISTVKITSTGHESLEQQRNEEDMLRNIDGPNAYHMLYPLYQLLEQGKCSIASDYIEKFEAIDPIYDSFEFQKGPTTYIEVANVVVDATDPEKLKTKRGTFLTLPKDTTLQQIISGEKADAECFVVHHDTSVVWVAVEGLLYSVSPKEVDASTIVKHPGDGFHMYECTGNVSGPTELYEKVLGKNMISTLDSMQKYYVTRLGQTFKEIIENEDTYSAVHLVNDVTGINYLLDSDGVHVLRGGVDDAKLKNAKLDENEATVYDDLIIYTSNKTNSFVTSSSKRTDFLARFDGLSLDTSFGRNEVGKVSPSPFTHIEQMQQVCYGLSSVF